MYLTQLGPRKLKFHQEECHPHGGRVYKCCILNPGIQKIAQKLRFGLRAKGVQSTVEVPPAQKCSINTCVIYDINIIYITYTNVMEIPQPPKSVFGQTLKHPSLEI